MERSCHGANRSDVVLGPTPTAFQALRAAPGRGWEEDIRGSPTTLAAIVLSEQPINVDDGEMFSQTNLAGDDTEGPRVSDDSGERRHTVDYLAGVSVGLSKTKAGKYIQLPNDIREELGGETLHGSEMMSWGGLETL